MWFCSTNHMHLPRLNGRRKQDPCLSHAFFMLVRMAIALVFSEMSVATVWVSLTSVQHCGWCWSRLLYLCQRGQQQHLQCCVTSEVIWGVAPGCTNSRPNLPAGNAASYPISFAYISFRIKLARVGVCCLHGCVGASSDQLRGANCSLLFLTRSLTLCW